MQHSNVSRTVTPSPSLTFASDAGQLTLTAGGSWTAASVAQSLFNGANGIETLVVALGSATNGVSVDRANIIAHAGTGLVAALADAARRDDAAREARELKRFFAATPDELGPVAIEAFDGLLAASMARDRDELEDFVDLVEALFP